MAFEEITDKRGGKPKTVCAVSIVNANPLYLGLRVRISGNVLAEVGWSHGIRIGFYWGSGGDAGKLRLTPDDNGNRLTRRPEQKAAHVSTCNVPDTIPLKRRSAITTPHTIDGDSVILELPDAFLIRQAAE